MADTTPASNDDGASLTLHLTVTGQQGAPRVPVKVAPTITATELRQRASETTSIPLTALRLIFRGRLINDDDTKQAVTEYKLEEGSVLHCMGKPLTTASSTNAASASTASNPVSATTAASSSSSTGGEASFAQQATTIPPNNIPASSFSPSASGGAGVDPLTLALQMLRASNTPSNYKTAVSTLDKILSNIIDHPLEDKYRQLKVQNPAFQKRLGGLSGGDALMKAAGFVRQLQQAAVEGGGPEEEYYVMQASADAWPKLVATKTAIESAVRETTAANVPALPTMAPPLFGGNSPGSFGMPGMGGALPPGMDSAVADLMADPNALQAMFQNPMVQNMMRNDPRLANNPMMRQVIDEITSNPMAAQQMSQMMRDPNMRGYMQTLMQQQQQQQQRGGGGMMMPPMPPVAPGGRGPTPGHQQQLPSQQQQQQQSGASDEQMTEEEMIAEAIRRSLQDS